MTELAVYEHHNSLTEQMDYAKAVSVASMLPDNYRNKPADIMLAVGLGQSMGLSPAESLYRISVIKGKPTASAELIAANVRKAGHRLRMRVEENPPSATCVIFRADDPDEPFEITRDMAWAQRMGLANNDNYKRQPSTMLSWRAISACARLACPEALYGVAHTPDEIEYASDRPPSANQGTAAERMGAVLGTTTVEQVEKPLTDVHTEATESPLLNTSSALAKAMYAGIKDGGIEENERIDWICHVIGRDITSTKEMTDAEAHDVLAVLDRRKADLDNEPEHDGAES